MANEVSFFVKQFFGFLQIEDFNEFVPRSTIANL